MLSKHRTGGVLAGLCVLTIATGASAASRVAVEAESAELLKLYPGLQLHESGRHVRVFYGRTMTQAPTAAEAAERFLRQHRAAFGVPDATFRQLFSNAVSQNRLTVFAIQQELDGIPVEYANGRIVVSNGAQTNSVFYAAAKVAARPEGGFKPDVLSAGQAMSAVRSQERYAGLTEWTHPEMVIYAGIDEMALPEPVRAWKFRGNNTTLAGHEAYTFFVDAAGGALVHLRNEVIHVNVSGNVSGFVTPGTKPDVASNPEVQIDLRDVRVNISGGSFAYTDAAGDFTITNGGASNVTVIAPVLGRWVNVNNAAGADLSSSQVVTPPGPADFVLNSTSVTEQTTAQMNGLVHTNSTHDFYVGLQPGFAGNLNIVMPCNVNIGDVCNAFYNGSSINFYLTGGGCRNSAYSTVIAHEYGHHIVNRLFLPQAAFGEGFADCTAMLQYDTHIMGEDFCGTGCHIRRPEIANVQYPCPADPNESVHFCGQVLGGVVWDLRQNLGAALGNPTGLDVARQLWSDWSQITSGPASGEAAHPGTAIEFLIADDTDADIGNGTPHMFEICNAFQQHSIDCPTVVLGDMILPDGAPEFALPDETFTVRADAVPLAGTPDPGTGMVHYRIGEVGSFTSIPMAELAPNEYEATLPGGDCEEIIHYYFSYDDVLGITIIEPDQAPTVTYSTTYALDFDEAVSYDFETAAGWTPSGSASAGLFQRGAPSGGNGAPEADFDGSGQCWVTGLNPGVDLDGGPVFLTSPAIDLTSTTDPYVSYARWFSNDTGSNPSQDSLSVEVSHNNGTNWFFLESVGPSGAEASGGWFRVKHRILDALPSLTSEFKIRFIAFDSLSQDSTVEVGVDGLNVFDIVCEVGGLCGDFDMDGDVDLADFASFAQCFAGPDNPPDSNCPAGVDADCDDDGDVDLADFATFAQNFTGPL